MSHSSLRIIREEHTALAAMLRSMVMMIERGPGNAPEQYFDVVKAMLFYIDEFPERLHHPKESELLFPRVASRVPEVRQALERLESDHANSEKAVRELQHLLLAWEMLGESRRAAFETAAKKYLAAYMDHMQLEESAILPAAQRVLEDADWDELDAAFSQNCDPLTGKYPRDPLYDKLFSRIVMRAPAPIGLGA